MDSNLRSGRAWVALAVAAAIGATSTGWAASPADEGLSAELDEVTVTGSRIRRNGFDAPTPVTVVGVEQMEQLGQVNVAEALSSIPQNSSFLSETNAGQVVTANVGSNFANLRGLNPFFGTRTLTLVDGRRFVPTSDGGAVDLNVIPSALIGRIETVTGGASAAYGSDAVAGVVNVLLDRNFTGMKAQFDVGRTFHGDGNSKHASIGFGSAFANGRGHIVVGGEYQDSGGIGGCAEVRTWCAPSWDVFTNNGLVDDDATPQRASEGAAPQDRNRRYLGQPNFIIAPGSKQAFNVAQGVFRDQANTDPALRYLMFNDAGTALKPMDPGRYAWAVAFGPRSGGDGDSTFEDSMLRAPVERYSLFTHANYDLTDSIEGFAEVSWAGREVAVNQYITGPRSTMFVRGDNPYLTPEIRAMFPAPPNDTASLGKDLDGTYRSVNRSEVTTLRAVAGLSGRLADTWHWDGYYQYGRNEREQTFSRARVNHFFQYALDAVDEGEYLTGTPNGNIVCRATLQPTIPEGAEDCVPMNLFGLDNLTEEAVNYAYRTAPEDFEYTQHVVAASTTGELFGGIGAGPFRGAVGAEYRSEKGDVSHRDIPYYNEFAFSYGQDFGGSIKVLEGFFELNAPLLRDQPFARQLEFNGAVRRTRNKSHDAQTGDSKTTSITSWKLSSIWDPVSWLRLRGTRSLDVRAAGFRELYYKTVPSEVGTTLGSVSNPWNGNATDNTPVLGGGEFGLAPEKAYTTTVGAVFSPGGVANGLRLSADWYQIKIQGAITSTNASQLVNFCYSYSAFCERIDFTDDSRTDITFIRATDTNLGGYAVRGADFELDYTLPLSRFGDAARGTLNLRALATLNYDLIVTSAPGATPVDFAGQTGPTTAFGNFNSGPKWQLNTMLTYSLDRFSTTLNVRHIPSGKLNANWIGPDDPRYAALIEASMSDLVSAAPTNTVSNNRVEGRTYLGLSATYKVPFGNNGANWEVFGTINNLLNEDPPIAPGGNAGPGSNYPTNPVYFDTVGAQFRAGVRMRF